MEDMDTMPALAPDLLGAKDGDAPDLFGGKSSPVTSFDSDDDRSVDSSLAAGGGGGKMSAIPMRGIQEPGGHDCVSGRGGGTNYHPGNLKFRKMVEDRKPAYKAAGRGKKPELAAALVREWRALDPPGRFLKLNNNNKRYDDIGDAEAKAKCSQALREKRHSTLVADGSTTYNSRVQQPSTAGAAAGGVPALPQPNGGALRDADVAMAMQQLAGEGAALVSQLAEASNAAQSAAVPGLMVSTACGKVSVAAPTNPSSSILAQCLSLVGITDLSLLSGTVETEFAAIKASYFQTILRVHPDCSPRDPASGASFRCARAAFAVLRALLHKLRLQRSTFFGLASAAEGNRDFVRDMLEEQLNLVSVTQSSPSFNHYTIASRQILPLVHVGLSGGQCLCAKCNKPIALGSPCVGSLTDGQWQHLACWSVPIDVWSGLSQQLDPSVSLRDTASMDEVILRGFAALDYASQQEFVSHIRRRENWVLRRAEASPLGLLTGPRPVEAAVGSSGVPPLATHNSGSRRSIAEETGEDHAQKDARPLKKRAIETPEKTEEVPTVEVMDPPEPFLQSVGPPDPAPGGSEGGMDPPGPAPGGDDGTKDPPPPAGMEDASPAPHPAADHEDSAPIDEGSQQTQKCLSLPEVRAIFALFQGGEKGAGEGAKDVSIFEGHTHFHIVVVPKFGDDIAAALAPPPYEYQEGVYVFLRLHVAVPPELSDRVLLHRDLALLADRSWGLSGPQIPTGCIDLKQRSCRPKGEEDDYRGRTKGSLWTAVGESGEEGYDVRVFHVYRAAQPSANSPFKEAPALPTKRKQPEKRSSTELRAAWQMPPAPSVPFEMPAGEALSSFAPSDALAFVKPKRRKSAEGTKGAAMPPNNEIVEGVYRSVLAPDPGRKAIRPWTAEEDRVLLDLIGARDSDDARLEWCNLASHLSRMGVARTGKQCRERYVNFLKPGRKKGGWTEGEDELVMQLHAQLGNQWSKIAAEMPGRSDNDVKNRWHSKQRTYKRKQAKEEANDASLSEKILERYGPARDAIDALGEEVAAKSSQKQKAKTAGTEAFDTAAVPEVGQKVEVDFDGEKRIGTITEVEAGSFQFAKGPAGAYKELALYNISIRFGDEDEAMLCQELVNIKSALDESSSSDGSEKEEGQANGETSVNVQLLKSSMSEAGDANDDSVPESPPKPEASTTGAVSFLRQAPFALLPAPQQQQLVAAAQLLSSVSPDTAVAALTAARQQNSKYSNGETMAAMFLALTSAPSTAEPKQVAKTKSTSKASAAPKAARKAFAKNGAPTAAQKPKAKAKGKAKALPTKASAKKGPSTAAKPHKRRMKEKSNAKAAAKGSAKGAAAKIVSKDAGTIYAIKGLSELDVVSGRGGVANKFVGNKRFRDEVSKTNLKAEYRTPGLSNEGKRDVAEKVITLVKGYGGRFMKMGGDGKWREMKHEDSHKKAVAALREVKW
ncbi:hypothetical protein ACHAXT_012981 [Thalassiosira profunda]